MLSHMGRQRSKISLSPASWSWNLTKVWLKLLEKFILWYFSLRVFKLNNFAGAFAGNVETRKKIKIQASDLSSGGTLSRWSKRTMLTETVFRNTWSTWKGARLINYFNSEQNVCSIISKQHQVNFANYTSPNKHEYKDCFYKNFIGNSF